MTSTTWSCDMKTKSEVDFCFWKSGVLEELWIFNPQWQMRRKKLLPELPLFLGRLPWRRGKWFNMCRKPRLGTESDFNHLDFFVAKFFFGVEFCFQKGEVLEELWISKRYWHVRRKKLLPELPLFLGRLPWRRGKWFNMCRNPRLGTENDFNHLVLWSNLCRSIFVFKKLAFWRS